MKKIYILTAVFALLTLSLNAQDGETKVVDNTPKFTGTIHNQTQSKTTTIKGGNFTLNDALRGIKGMSSILPAIDPNGSSSHSGQMRAPMKINSGEELMGPYTTDDFSTNGLGFTNAYGSNGQQIYMFADLVRSDFVDFDGEDIVGFRFALAGNSTDKAILYDFHAWPYGQNGYFESANRHTWSIPEYAGVTPVSGFDDIVITVPGNSVVFSSITLYDQNNNVISSWNSNGTVHTVTSGSNTYTVYDLPNGWSLSNVYMFRWNNSGNYYGYLSSTSQCSITIDGSLLDGCTGGSIVINAMGDYGTESLDVNGDSRTVTTSIAPYTFNLSPTTVMPVYVELEGGQWHEFYLDEPIPFNVADSIVGMYLGYRYWQYPSTETSEFLYPIAVNPNNATHDHVSYRYGAVSGSYSDITITPSGTAVNFTRISLVSGNTTIKEWVYNSSNYALPTGWTCSANWNSYQSTVCYTSGTITIPASDFSGYSNVQVVIKAYGDNSSQYITVNGDQRSITTSTSGSYSWNITATTTYQSGWWSEDFSQYGDLAVQLIFKSRIPKTDAPVITADTTATSVIITATATDPTATVTLTVDNGTPETGTGSVSVTIPRTNSDQTVNVSATAQVSGMLVSDPATAQIGVPALPITPTPVITYEVTANSVIITATGQGEVTLTVGNEQPVTGTNSVSVTIPRTTEDQTVTATATAVAPNHQPSAQAQETILIPEGGRSPKPTIVMTDNGDGSYTITVTGTGEVVVYIADAEHGNEPIATADGTFSFIVEQHSQAMSITVQATNQEPDLAISRVTEETFNIPAMTIDSEFKELDPQPENASTPIDMSKLMFVDRFSKVIPDRNNHPRLYDYYMQETQVRQRTSNSVEVEVKHTGSDGLGFYTLSQIDNDTDAKLEMNVRNAATEIPLEPDPKVFFYTVQRGTKTYPDEADRKWLGVLQRTSDGNYQETLNPSYDYEEIYHPGSHVHYDTDTITGDFNSYLTYVPVVWTMGFDRYNYRMGIDEEHNSYGAPKWRTGVADVNIEAVRAERQIGKMGSTSWVEDGIPCSMYMIDTITAIGSMPTRNTMPYEPYMFRVFVQSDNGKLRGYRKLGDGAEIYDGTHYQGDGNGPQTGPICVWSEYVNGSNHIGVENNNYTFSRGKISEVDSLDHWIVPDYLNMLFAAEDTLLTEQTIDGRTVIRKDELNIFVRFYYIVEGSAQNHVVGMRDGGDAPAGYGSESPGTSPSPSTAVHEIIINPGDIVSQKYYNVQGMESDTPFDGINIVVTRYSSGLTRTTKVVR